MKTFEKFLLGMIVGGLICMIVYGLTSCKTSGMGCRGKESWNHVVKRINSQ